MRTQLYPHRHHHLASTLKPFALSPTLSYKNNPHHRIIMDSRAPSTVPDGKKNFTRTKRFLSKEKCYLARHVNQCHDFQELCQVFACQDINTSSSVAGEAATSPSIAQDTRTVNSPLTNTGLVLANSSIGSEARPATPALSAGGDSIPSSALYSTSRSPSPDAEELISSLANYESLSDDALYNAALKARQVMVKWQDAFSSFQDEVSRMRRSSYSQKNPKANPRKLEDPKEYDRKHYESLQQLRFSIIRIFPEA